MVKTKAITEETTVGQKHEETVQRHKEAMQRLNEAFQEIGTLGVMKALVERVAYCDRRGIEFALLKMYSLMGEITDELIAVKDYEKDEVLLEE